MSAYYGQPDIYINLHLVLYCETRKLISKPDTDIWMSSLVTQVIDFPR